MEKSKVEKILDGASAVVFKEGISNLTFEGVAQKVGMSKGGVLYHFATKDKLIEAMVQRVADHWRRGFEEAYENEPEGAGRATRALLTCVLSNTDGWDNAIRETSSAVFAALAYNPVLIEPMRKFYQEMNQKIDTDGLPPGIADTILASIDGMWLWWVLDFRKIDEQLVANMRKTLTNLSQSLNTKNS